MSELLCFLQNTVNWFFFWKSGLKTYLQRWELIFTCISIWCVRTCNLSDKVLVMFWKSLNKMKGNLSSWLFCWAVYLERLFLVNYFLNVAFSIFWHHEIKCRSQRVTYQSWTEGYIRLCVDTIFSGSPSVHGMFDTVQPQFRHWGYSIRCLFWCFNVSWRKALSYPERCKR